jgi:hypothetical protein
LEIISRSWREIWRLAGDKPIPTFLLNILVISVAFALQWKWLGPAVMNEGLNILLTTVAAVLVVFLPIFGWKLLSVPVKIHREQQGRIRILEEQSIPQLALVCEQNGEAIIQPSSIEGEGMFSGRRLIARIRIKNVGMKPIHGVRVSLESIQSGTVTIPCLLPLRFSSHGECGSMSLAGSQEEFVDVMSYNAKILQNKCRVETSSDYQYLQSFVPGTVYALKIKAVGFDVPDCSKQFLFWVDASDSGIHLAAS